MPTYTYACSKCDAEQDEYRTVARRDDPVTCSVCGGQSKKIIAPHRVIADLQPYYDENLESWVKSKQDRKRIMRDQGVAEMYGKGWH